MIQGATRLHVENDFNFLNFFLQPSKSSKTPGKARKAVQGDARVSAPTNPHQPKKRQQQDQRRDSTLGCGKAAVELAK